MFPFTIINARNTQKEKNETVMKFILCFSVYSLSMSLFGSLYLYIYLHTFISIQDFDIMSPPKSYHSLTQLINS